jgi:hypothetical protein
MPNPDSKNPRVYSRSINPDTSLIYHLNPQISENRSNYMQVLGEPNLRAAIRESTASHTGNALSTGEREMVARQIYD